MPTLGSKSHWYGNSRGRGTSTPCTEYCAALYYDDKPMTNVGKRHETPRTATPSDPPSFSSSFFPFVFSFFHPLLPQTNQLTFSSGSTEQQPAISAGGLVSLISYSDQSPLKIIPLYRYRYRYRAISKADLQSRCSAARSEVFCWCRPGLVSSSNQLQIHLATLR